MNACTAYRCENCDPDGLACSDCRLNCPHETYENNACTVCGKVCLHDAYENSICTVCGTDCPHDIYNNGFCADCGGHQGAWLNENGYFEISNAGQLFWFMEHVNGGNNTANAILTENIDINPGYTFKANGTVERGGTTVESGWREWFPIGYVHDRDGDGGEEVVCYKGIFDGNNKTVSGLYFNSEAQDFVGLIGYVDGNGTVRDLGVTDSYVRGYSNVGGVVGYIVSGTVENCYNIGTVSGSYFVGGVVGRNVGTVTNCYYLSGCAKGGNITEDVAGITEGKTAEQFASGEVARLLGSAWGQNIGTDTYPVARTEHNAVYYGYITCAENATKVYTNDSTASEERPDHVDSDIDNDHLCDNDCGQQADEGCHDADTDHKCDECGADIVHDYKDEDSDGKSDEGGADIVHDRKDEDSDEKSDVYASDIPSDSDTKSSSGCGSTVAIASICLVGVIGTALVIKKKD